MLGFMGLLGWLVDLENVMPSGQMLQPRMVHYSLFIVCERRESKQYDRKGF